MFKSLKKTAGRPLFFPRARKYTEKRAAARARARTFRDPVARWHDVCNFIIFIRLESHAERKISNCFPLSCAVNSRIRPDRWAKEFNEVSPESVLLKSRKLTFAVYLPFMPVLFSICSISSPFYLRIIGPTAISILPASYLPWVQLQTRYLKVDDMYHGISRYSLHFLAIRFRRSYVLL